MRDLQAAASAAGCVLRSFPSEGRGTARGKVAYRTNPPTSGRGGAVSATDRVFASYAAPAPEEVVRALEHGRIALQYRRETSRTTVSELETLFEEDAGRRGHHLLLFQNPTHMRYGVAATAWRHLIGCERVDGRVLDALRAFRDRYIDQGPAPAGG